MSAGPDRARRVGILGGSFDPVHQGHLHAARAALAAFDLDRVVFVPAAEPPHKPGRRLADGADRLAMLERAIRGEPRFSACDIELERGGTSYTIDTVRALRARLREPEESELFLIVGSDNVPGLPAWRDARALLELVQPVVVHRADERDEARARAGARDGAHDVAPSQGADPDGAMETMLAGVTARMGHAAAAKLRAGWLRLPPVPVSSTHLRAELCGLQPDARRHGLDPAVLEYIRAHGLYGMRA